MPFPNMILLSNVFLQKNTVPILLNVQSVLSKTTSSLFSALLIQNFLSLNGIDFFLKPSSLSICFALPVFILPCLLMLLSSATMTLIVFLLRLLAPKSLLMLLLILVPLSDNTAKLVGISVLLQSTIAVTNVTFPTP